MLGARVHINGVPVPNTEALCGNGGDDGRPAREVKPAALSPDCRIVFGLRHFFRLDDANTKTASAQGNNDEFDAVPLLFFTVVVPGLHP